ncbi:MAG: GNAT family protein [Trueperaceae bacterium]|nr:GNAT family protein [Trueperaceae bacterium]
MFLLPIDDDLALWLLEHRHAEPLFARVEENRDELGRWLPWVETTRSPDDVRAFIERGLARFARGDGFETGIALHGRLVGCLGLHYVSRPEGCTEIGFWLAREAQGAGVMSRAVAGLLPHLYDDLDLRRVEIRCNPANEDARAVPERLGFREEGVLRQVGFSDGQPYDHVVYALLRDEWKERFDEATH